jgi:hypothetical protein
VIGKEIKNSGVIAALRATVNRNRRSRSRRGEESCLENVRAIPASSGDVPRRLIPKSQA